MIKKIIKKTLSTFYFLFKKNKKFSFIDISQYKNTFFGYYDVTSFSSDDEKVICHGEKEDGSVDILLYDINTKEHNIIANTFAWNYQQGSRLMWFSKDEIIFNNYNIDTGEYYSVIKNIHNFKEEIVEYPIQAVHKNDFILSIDYSELHTLGTEYGYSLESGSSNFGKLFKYDFNSKKSTLLFNVDKCKSLLSSEYEKFDKLHFNHFLINSTGDYFIFIFRFFENNKRIDSLFGYSVKNEKLELLIENQLISHSVWKDKSSFVFWGGIDDVNGYYEFNITDKSLSLKVDFKYDGHPTFISDNVVITDTYPNRILAQKLFLLDLESKNETVLAEFKHPADYVSYNRCDLHPSISNSKKMFQVDVINKKGKRAICIGRI